MATVESRYQVATAYVARAIASVESSSSLVKVIDRYAAKIKTAPVRDALAQVQARWLRATSEGDRAMVAREAELLADRTKENLPGAPQDWARTNLFVGERETSTPATSYRQWFNDEAAADWAWLSGKAASAADAGKGVAEWLLIGGGLLVAWKAFDYFGKRQTKTTAALNRELERAAEAADELDAR